MRSIKLFSALRVLPILFLAMSCDRLNDTSNSIENSIENTASLISSLPNSIALREDIPTTFNYDDSQQVSVIDCSSDSPDLNVICSASGPSLSLTFFHQSGLTDTVIHFSVVNENGIIDSEDVPVRVLSSCAEVSQLGLATGDGQYVLNPSADPNADPTFINCNWP